MSNINLSKIPFQKRMCDYATYERKAKKMKTQHEEVQIKKRMCEFGNCEAKSKKMKNDFEDVYVNYNQRETYTYEDYYTSLFHRNKICKETNNINYLRSKPKCKQIKTWQFIKGEVNTSNVKHTESVMQNIRDYKENKSENLENKPIPKEVLEEVKKVEANQNNAYYKKCKLTKKQTEYSIIFPNENERKENFPSIFTTFLNEKDNFKMKSAELLKIKQEPKKKICHRCGKIVRSDYLKRHQLKHKGKFFFDHYNISSLQMNQLFQMKSCFEFYDFDAISNLEQKERNKQIKQFAQVANRNKKMLCFLSRFQKKISLRTTRLKFWSFPKKKNIVSNEANKANFFSRHECDIKQTVQINSVFRQNDSQKKRQTLYNLLKLSLTQRTKLYIVFEYMQKIGTFKFVNFNVKTKHKNIYTFKKRAKRKVQHLPNCLQIKKEDFDFIFNYFHELKVINVEKHLNIRRKKRKNGIFSRKYHYLDVNDIDRVSKQFHMVHEIDTIFNCLNISNHYEIMGTLFNQLRKKFGSNFYSISSDGSSLLNVEQFYGSSLLNVQKPIMSHVLNEFVERKDLNVDPYIIESTKHFIKKYYVPYYIRCFKNDCSKLLKATPFKAVKLKKSKQFIKFEKFEKKKIIQNRQEWLMVQIKFNEDSLTPLNTEQVTIETEEIKLQEEVKEEVKELCYVPVDCSSMPIIRQSKPLENYSTFLLKSKEKSLQDDTTARKIRKEKEMPFLIAQKEENESFYEFSLRCYEVLEKVELTVDNKINDYLISKRIFDKIWNHTLVTDSSLYNFNKYFKESQSNVITACLKFDIYLKNINCDHLVTIE